MSKLFLEINEQIESNNKIPKEFRIEVKDKKEALSKLKVEEPNWVGLTYRKRLHKCFHDEKNNQSCEVSNL